MAIFRNLHDRLECSCGARSKSKGGEVRFRARHPKLCSKRIKTALEMKKLASTTKCVDAAFNVFAGDPPEVGRLELLKRALADAADRGRELTPWEEKFVEDLSSQLDSNVAPTDAQLDKALEIARGARR